MPEQKDHPRELTGEEAVKHYQKIVAENPNDCDAHLNLASAYYGVRDYNSAFDELQKTIAIAPDTGHAHYYLGVIYAKRGEPENARKEFQAVISGSGNPLLQDQAKIQLASLDGKIKAVS